MSRIEILHPEKQNVRSLFFKYTKENQIDQ